MDEQAPARPTAADRSLPVVDENIEEVHTEGTQRRKLEDEYEASVADSHQSLIVDALTAQADAMREQTTALRDLVQGALTRSSQPRSSMKVQPNVKLSLIHI